MKGLFALAHDAGKVKSSFSLVADADKVNGLFPLEAEVARQERRRKPTEGQRVFTF